MRKDKFCLDLKVYFNKVFFLKILVPLSNFRIILFVFFGANIFAVNSKTHKKFLQMKLKDAMNDNKFLSIFFSFAILVKRKFRDLNELFKLNELVITNKVFMLDIFRIIFNSILKPNK